MADPIDPDESPRSYEGYYYRGPAEDQSPERLQKLFDGYNGLTYVFAVNVALVLGFQFAGFNGALVLPFYAGLLVLIGALSYPSCKRIAEAKRWSHGAGELAAFLLGLSSALCCGAIGVVVMQRIAGNEMKRMGLVPRGMLGIHKSDVVEAKARLQAARPPVVPPFEP